MKALVIGGAGFIGSHLVDRLLADGSCVHVLDDFSAGRQENYRAHAKDWRLRVTQLPQDTAYVHPQDDDRRRRPETLETAMHGADVVFHLAANPCINVRDMAPDVHVKTSTVLTAEILAAMRRAGVPTIVFTSSASVYGDQAGPCCEDDAGGRVLSLYAAGKRSAEDLISAYAEQDWTRGVVFRFGNIVGPRLRHAVHFDLFQKLRAKPYALKVLGDGQQRRPFVHVTDCVDGMLAGLAAAKDPFTVYNLTSHGSTTVATVAEAVVAASVYPQTPIEYEGSERGWKGDVRHVSLDGTKLAAAGWTAKLTSDTAAERAATEMAAEVDWFGRTYY